MVGEADFPSPVHLGRFAVELRQGDLGRGGRVGHGNVELHFELVLQHLVDIPGVVQVSYNINLKPS